VVQTWEVFYPAAAATGLFIARCRVEPTAVLWLHAAPDVLAVTVREGDDRVIARGEGLRRAGEYVPLTRLTLEGDQVAREDRWPDEADLGALVVLPGGEAGTLLRWWTAADGNTWRWSVEFEGRRG